MSTNIRFMVYNAFGIGGTVKTIFNFADYFQKTGKYNVEIISIKKTRETTMLYLNPKVKLTIIQDARRVAKYSDEDRELMAQPSELIHSEEDLYPMFNAYTDKRLKEVLGSFHDGVLVTTMPSFNYLATTLVDDKVLKVGQEHKSFVDHTPGLQQLIRENYCKLDALTILTSRNQHVYQKKIKGDLSIYVLGNGTERLPFKANLKNHVIVAAGRYSEEKGYDMLIKAFARIHERFPDWTLKIYGNGVCEKTYLALVKEYSLQDKVVLEPATDLLNEKLSEAAFQVCSSYREGFGMSIIEGFAMGVPCVSFACDGPREIITNEHDGLLIPREDIDALAAAMERTMSDLQFRLEMGKNAYETAKKFDINTIGGNFQKLVERELALKPKKLEEAKKQAANAVEKAAAAKKEEPETPVPENSTVEVATSEPETAEKATSDYIDYNQLTSIADGGKIGLKTILRMLKGWINYKLGGKKVG